MKINIEKTREKLSQCVIFELRFLGRMLGVKSPTSQSKENLVDSIAQALEQNPNFIASEPQHKRGRPAKHFDFLTLNSATASLGKESASEINDSIKKFFVLEDDEVVAPPIKQKAIKAPKTEIETEAPISKEVETKEPVKEVVKESTKVNKEYEPKPFQRQYNTPPRNNDNGNYGSNYNQNQKNTYNNNQNSNSNNYQQSTTAQANHNSNINNPNNSSYMSFNSQNINPNTLTPAFVPTEMEIREGILEICPDGYGFLRANNCEQGDGDAYILAQKIKKCGLRKGDYIVARASKLAENKPLSVVDIISINGENPENAFSRPLFENLVPIYPEKRYKLENDRSRNDIAIRSIDLVAPIGKGQRGLIVSPPKAGKTTLLKKIASCISVNNPEVHLMVLLIDERPEEVTDMKRNIDGEVIYSTFDELPEHHIKAAELVLERAKRLTELGKDVVILMDSLTRLARAYNLSITPTGKILSGGIDPGALYGPKRFFGAARNIENGGSLTIIATALIDTGSRMDDVIYEEFKGTGNMEIHLDRKLSEKRIFPAIDLHRSGTRREELLLDQRELEGIWAVRKMLSNGDSQETAENLIGMLLKTSNNREFIEILNLQINKLQKEGYISRN